MLRDSLEDRIDTDAVFLDWLGFEVRTESKVNDMRANVGAGMKTLQTSKHVSSSLSQGRSEWSKIVPGLWSFAGCVRQHQPPCFVEVVLSVFDPIVQRHQTESE